MSIKDNIKEELKERIDKRIEFLKKEHNNDVDIIDSPVQSYYEEGHIKAVDDELMFLHNLLRFVRSL